MRDRVGQSWQWDENLSFDASGYLVVSSEPYTDESRRTVLHSGTIHRLVCFGNGRLYSDIELDEEPYESRSYLRRLA